MLSATSSSSNSLHCTKMFYMTCSASHQYDNCAPLQIPTDRMGSSGRTRTSEPRCSCGARPPLRRSCDSLAADRARRHRGWRGERARVRIRGGRAAADRVWAAVVRHALGGGAEVHVRPAHRQRAGACLRRCARCCPRSLPARPLTAALCIGCRSCIWPDQGCAAYALHTKGSPYPLG